MSNLWDYSGLWVDLAEPQEEWEWDARAMYAYCKQRNIPHPRPPPIVLPTQADLEKDQDAFDSNEV